MSEVPSVPRGASRLAGRATGPPDRVDFGLVAESVDLLALIQREREVRNGKALCPFHENTSTPALSVYREDKRWRYKCHGCGASGDAIAWVAARESITLVEAARKLAGDGDYRVNPSEDRPSPKPEAPEEWRDPAWQVAVEALVVEAETRLWSGEGAEALRWLKNRGLADHTIRRFRLGFVASHYRSEAVEILAGRRGEGHFYSPRGITIPWLAPGASYQESLPVPRWVGCNVRRLAEPDVFLKLPDEVEKCQSVRGSRRGYLYPWPEILPAQGELPVLMVEGEFDALIGTQEVGHMLHVATAGSASVRTLPLASRSALAVSTWILLAMDHDQPGVKAVWDWRGRYPHKSRRVLLPSGKDLNDFFAGGGDVRAWVAEIMRPILK
jgi:DNA primase